jgi:hypothetical protein
MDFVKNYSEGINIALGISVDEDCVEVAYGTQKFRSFVQQFCERKFMLIMLCLVFYSY